jgi:hypothetical protein
LASQTKDQNAAFNDNIALGFDRIFLHEDERGAVKHALHAEIPMSPLHYVEQINHRYHLDMPAISA